MNESPRRRRSEWPPHGGGAVSMRVTGYESRFRFQVWVLAFRPPPGILGVGGVAVDMALWRRAR